MDQNVLALLGKVGLQLDSEIEGLIVTEATKTQVNRVFLLTAQTPDGKQTRKMYVGQKSFDEGILKEDDKGQIVIQPGFEVYDNEGRAMVRNKTRANNFSKLEVIK